MHSICTNYPGRASLFLDFQVVNYFGYINNVEFTYYFQLKQDKCFFTDYSILKINSLKIYCNNLIIIKYTEYWNIRIVKNSFHGILIFTPNKSVWCAINMFMSATNIKKISLIRSLYFVEITENRMYKISSFSPTSLSVSPPIKSIDWNK